MAINTPTVQTIYNSRQLTSPLMQSIMFGIVIVLFGWFLLKPAANQSIQAHQALKAADKQRETVENDKRDLERLISQLKTSPDDVKITDEAIPLVGRASRIELLLDGLAKNSGLQLSQIVVNGLDELISAGNKKELADPYGANRTLYTSKVSIVVTGSMDQFRNFLQLLETSGRLIDVSDLAVTSAQDTTQFRVTLKAYSYESADQLPPQTNQQP